MNTITHLSFAGRATLAIVLMLSFYLLALGMAAALIVLPVRVAHIPLPLIASSWIAAAIVLWSVIPRRQRFTEPGPRLEPHAQPRLFREIESLARAVDQPVPREVYVVLDVNAFVTRRGGILGFGGRRIVGIGLPLAATLNASEMRAVLAHEFGHFHGGDTRIGPWIHATRGAVQRTVAALGDSEHWFLILVHTPFRIYGALLLAITQAVARGQEFAADALAARVAGSRAMASSLRKSRAVALFYNGYFQGEFLAALQAGFRPPFAQGLAQFMAGVHSRSVGTIADVILEHEATGIHDSHPPTRERIAKLANAASSLQLDEAPALAWFDDLPALEAQLLLGRIPGVRTKVLRPMSWDEASDLVWIPHWRAQRLRIASHLRGSTVADLPQCLRDSLELGRLGAADDASDDEDARALGKKAIAETFALALVEHGWTLDSQPGGPFVLERGGVALEPFAIVLELTEGTIDAEVWRARATDLQIAELPLVDPARTAAPQDEKARAS